MGDPDIVWVAVKGKDSNIIPGKGLMLLLSSTPWDNEKEGNLLASL